MRKDVLRGLADNTELFAATKEAVLEAFAEQPYAEGASDELLGQITRARISGIQRVEGAFRQIEACKTAPKPQDIQNSVY
jgi:hypothetical protein